MTQTNTSCEDFYMNNVKLNSTSADALCQNSANFTFADPLKSAVALTTAYLYGEGFN